MESIESNLDRHRSLRPSCSGVVSCRSRRHLTAKLGTPDTRTKYGEMLTLNIIELLSILTSNWSKCSGRVWQGASRASQKFGFEQRGKDAKSKRMQKALWKPSLQRRFTSAWMPNVPISLRVRLGRSGFHKPFGPCTTFQVLQAMKFPAQAAVEALPCNFGATCQYMSIQVSCGWVPNSLELWLGTKSLALRIQN